MLSHSGAMQKRSSIFGTSSFCSVIKGNNSMRRLFALILAVFLWFGVAPALSANAATLTPCKDSPAFQQRAEASQSATAPRRFAAYSSLLCGEEGLPHLVVDPTAAHVGEFTIPAILFLYIAGWIGWAGRSYIQAAKNPAILKRKRSSLMFL